jgi:hypothetical protein
MIDANMMIDGLAVIGAWTCLSWLFRGLAAIQRQAAEEMPADGPASHPTAKAAAASSPAAAPAALVAEADGVPPEHVAAIGAAIFAMIGAHRIVHLDDHPGASWSAEGRWLHQTSHSRVH